MNRIRSLRTAAGMSQGQLGKKLGCHATTVSKLELESRQLDPPTIFALCDIFGCTADYLLGRSDAQLPAVNPEQERLLTAYAGATDRDRELVDHILGLDVPEKKKDATAAS